MPVIKVWCLPADQKEDGLRSLHQSIVDAVVSVGELGVSDQNGMTVLFPPDSMQYGLGEEIIVEIEMFKKPERTRKVRQLLATRVGVVVAAHYPKSKVEVGPIRMVDPKEDGFWSSD